MMRFGNGKPAAGDRVLVYGGPDARLVVEGLRDPASGEFFPTGLYRRVELPDVPCVASGAATMLVVGAEAARVIASVEDWIAQN
jgi:hypothetical protein